MLSDGVNYQGVLLTLLLEQVVCSYLRQAKDVGEISVLITCELSDVALCDLLESLLSLHFLEALPFVTHRG